MAPATVPNVEWERLRDGPDRALHTMIYDPVHELYWIFGGLDANGSSTSYFNTLYRLDATDPQAQWQPVQAGAVSPDPRAFHSAIYDPFRERMVVFGGLFADETVASGEEVWFLDLHNPDSPTWSRVSVAGGPSDRFAHAVVYVPEFDAMVISGGLSTFTSTHDDHYALRLGESPLRWVRLTSVGMGGRAGHALIHDPAGQRLIAYGGLTDFWDANAFHDILTLDLSGGLELADAWLRLEPATPGTERAFMAAAFDPVRRLIWVHGGVADNMTFHSDLSALDLAVGPPVWTRTSAEVNGPRSRFTHAAVWDRTRERMVVHGGSPDNQGTAGDTYAFTALAGTATRTATVTATSSGSLTGTPTPSATFTSVPSVGTPTVTTTPATASPSPTTSPPATSTLPPITPDSGHIFLPLVLRNDRSRLPGSLLIHLPPAAAPGP